MNGHRSPLLKGGICNIGRETSQAFVVALTDERIDEEHLIKRKMLQCHETFLRHVEGWRRAPGVTALSHAFSIRGSIRYQRFAQLRWKFF